MAEKAVEKRRPYETAILELHARAKMEADSGFGAEVATSVADRIMEAETIEAVLAIPEQGPGNLDDMVGKAFRFIGGQLHWAISAEQFREGGTGVYAVFKVLDMNDMERMVSTGAVNVVFQLRRLEKLGLFDNDGEISKQYFTVKARPVPSGTLYWLGAA